jgi:ABC-type Zn2+ transport system substrate-binding protein/surface adhesin
VKVKAASKAGLVTSPKKATVTKTMKTTRTSRKKQDSDSDEEDEEDEDEDENENENENEDEEGDEDDPAFRGVKQLMLNGHAWSYIVPETVGELEQARSGKHTFNTSLTLL